MQRSHLIRSAATVAVLALLGAAPGARADDVLAQAARPTDLSAGQGLVVYSAYDTSSRRYRLMQISKGVTSRVDVPSSPAPFDADVGPTTSGHAYLVYERCARARAASSGLMGCDIYAFNPATGVERRSHASDPKHDDVNPTYWKGRLVFARDYGSKSPRQIVYQRPNGHTSRSQRLPGLPRRRCAHGQCLPVSGSFEDLELFGRQLAEAADSTEPIGVTDPDGKPFEGDVAELRLVDVVRGTAEQLSGRGAGESGQTWVAASFDRGRLYAYFSCLGDSSGCNAKNAGAYRYRLSTGDWQISGSGSALGGFAVGGGRTYELKQNEAGGCGRIDGAGADEDTCAIVRRTPDLVYKDTHAP